VPGMHSWVRKWAMINGSQAAVTCDGFSVSWAELDHRVDVLAQHMVSLGITAGDRVGCLMPNCVEFVQALHAASRIEAIFVPINIRYTSSELAFAAKHVDLSLLMVDESFAEVVADANLTTTMLWRSGWPTDGEPFAQKSATQWSDDGFLLFTSGSTGAPRGVLHSQESFFWTSMDAVLIHKFNSNDKMVTPLPLCFTGGLNVATAMAHSGGELILMSSFDADAALTLIEARKATLFHGVPVMCQRLVDHPRWPTADLSSLRLARTGAAPVASGLMQAWLERGIPLTQGYGSTESAGAGFTLPAKDAHRFGKCGRPSFYADIKVVAPDTGQPVPVGEVGEILLSGPQVMRRYWLEPEATAATVREGWLWTGDLAFVDEDGFYEITGRSKDLIITGGLNVYPAEVEHVVRAAPGVLEAAVIGTPSLQWGEEVVAVVVPSGADVDTDQVIAYCRTVLADYKCPKLVLVSRQPLPRTASGKVVKRDVQQWAAESITARAPAG
jgi:fatty-acyl-CoA synthase